MKILMAAHCQIGDASGGGISNKKKMAPRRPARSGASPLKDGRRSFSLYGHRLPSLYRSTDQTSFVLTLGYQNRARSFSSYSKYPNPNDPHAPWEGL